MLIVSKAFIFDEQQNLRAEEEEKEEEEEIRWALANCEIDQRRVISSGEVALH